MSRYGYLEVFQRVDFIFVNVTLLSIFFLMYVTHMRNACNDRYAYGKCLFDMASFRIDTGFEQNLCIVTLMNFL